MKHSVLFPVVAGLLLLLMAVLSGGAALRESVVIDEVAHIGAGLSYLQKFDLRLNEEHPPLAKILAAIPLIVRGTHADYSDVSWTASRKFLPHAYLGEWIFGEWVLEHWNNPVSTLAWARFPMLLLTLTLGWIFYVYASRIGGPWAGLLCLAVYVSMPVFLTFGPLVLTDVAITLFSILTLWTFASLWQEPTRKSTLLFGLCLAGALLSKFSAGLLFVVFGVFSLSTRWLPVPGQPAVKSEIKIWRRLRWRAARKGILGAAVIVYVVYFVFSINQTTDVLYLVGHGPAWWPLRRLLMPPWLYLRGILVIAVTFSRPAFILGLTHPHGVWFFFPVLFLLKSPLGFLGLLASGLGVALSRKRKGDIATPAIPTEKTMHWRVLWVGCLVLVVLSILSHFDVSYRHFMVPLALLILLLAPLPVLLKQLCESAPLTGRAMKALTVLLAASCLFTAIRTYPYYFPYLNALSLGHPAYELASDSNVDWNHALPDAKRFADEHHQERLEIDGYGFNDPAAAVPGSEIWNCQLPTAADAGQWVVVSSNMLLDAHNCTWLLRYPHEALGGGSMYAVHLPSPIPAAGNAGGPPLPSAQRQFLSGPIDMRVFFLDIIRHPEKFPAAAALMEAQMAEAIKTKKPPTYAP